MPEIKATLGGVAVVCCLHDREKRQIRSEAAVAELGRSLGQTYDPTQHRLFECACCENLFVGEDDEPKFCYACRGRKVYPPAGPLPQATGRL